MRLGTQTSKPSCLATDGKNLAGEHLTLVSEILRQVTRRLPAHVDRDDLVGAGALALVEAAVQYDPSLGSEFSAFATKRIRGAMLDELRRWDWAARSVRSDRRRRENTADCLRMQLGREPNEDELARAEGTSVEQLRRSESDVARATLASLHDVMPAGGAEQIATDAASPIDLLIEREERAYVRSAVASLPERERRAVAGYYLQDRPMWELAGELGVTASRVSQLCKRGLSLLHQALASYIGGAGPDWSRAPERAREDMDLQPLPIAG